MSSSAGLTRLPVAPMVQSPVPFRLLWARAAWALADVPRRVRRVTSACDASARAARLGHALAPTRTGPARASSHAIYVSPFRVFSLTLDGWMLLWGGARKGLRFFPHTDPGLAGRHMCKCMPFSRWRHSLKRLRSLSMRHAVVEGDAPHPGAWGDKVRERRHPWHSAHRIVHLVLGFLGFLVPRGVAADAVPFRISRTSS